MQIVLGTRRNPIAADRLVAALRPLGLGGTLYIGYPIVASADEHVFVDALLTCEEHGMVAFDLDAPVQANVTQRQDSIYAALLQRLIAFRPLRHGRELAFDIHVVTFAPSPLTIQLDDATVVTKLGKSATVKDLHAGDPVTVSYATHDGKPVAKRVWIKAR